MSNKKKEDDEEETLDGYDIPLRKLTEEEAARPITLDRFNDFHADVCEDFVDQFGNIDIKVLSGYMMAKHPELSKEILEVCNDEYGEALGIKHLFEDNGLTEDAFYTELADFINLTVNLKKRVNQILIQIYEYYNK